MKILVVGISTRSMIQSAVAAGYDVISLDFFGDSDQPACARVLALTRDFGLPPTFENLAFAARQLAGEADAVVFGSGVENCDELFAACSGMQIFGSDLSTIQKVRNPDYLASVLHQSGMVLPEARSSGHPLPEKGRWLLKDLGHSGGMGVCWWDKKTAPQGKQVLQEWIKGMLCSVTFLANGKKAVILGMTRQYAGVPQLNAQEFAWCGNTAPLLDTELENIVMEAASRLTREFHLLGINGIDFIVNERTPYLLEVNPRFPSSTELLERRLKLNAFELHMQACAGKLPDLQPNTELNLAIGKGILYARQPVRIEETASWAAFDLADIPHEGEEINQGEPVCSVFAEGEGIEECWQNVLLNAKRLEKLIFDQPDA